MSNPAFIRSLFHPQQPAEDSTGRGRLFYKEQMPCVALRPYIYCFWELRAIKSLATTYSYRVISDGCIDLVVDCQSFNGMIIAGITSAATEVQVDGNVSYFGIRFLPAGISHFIKFPLHEIQNLMTPISDLSERAADELSKLVFEKKDFEQKIRVTESFLLKKMYSQNTEMHPALAHALHHILHTSGDLSIQTKAAQWISPRQLRRLFHEHIGCSPKLFARIVRFQKTLYTMRYGKTVEKLNSFYQHGYFDQAHFIKEFKLLYGATPRSIKLQTLEEVSL